MICVVFMMCMCAVLKAETVRFEEEVIRGGPIALPGTLALLTEVSKAHLTTPVSPLSANPYTSPALFKHCLCCMDHCNIR